MEQSNSPIFLFLPLSSANSHIGTNDMVLIIPIISLYEMVLMIAYTLPIATIALHNQQSQNIMTYNNPI